VTHRPLLVLASASPARHKLLLAAGIEAAAIVSGIDESAVDFVRADLLSSTLARMKAQAVADTLRRDRPREHTLVLGCDSVLEFDGEILGKPRDAAEATARWQRMRGRSGVLYTGHCLLELLPEKVEAPEKRAEAVRATTVHFADVSDDEIAAYVRSGEPLHVAGAFTIDGLGGPFVESIQGDPGNVIGLSLPLLRRLLGELGIAITQLWREPDA
jgi:septum formation protein